MERMTKTKPNKRSTKADYLNDSTILSYLKAIDNYKLLTAVIVTGKQIGRAHV